MSFQHFHRVRPFSQSVRSALGRTFATCQEYGGGGGVGGGTFLARAGA